MTERLVYYTGDLIESDDSRLCLMCKQGTVVGVVCDNCGYEFTESEFKEFTAHTDVYGEPTMEGHGQVMTSGWVQPDWSLWTVYDERGDVEPDVMGDDEERDPITWLAETITSRLGAIDTWDGGGSLYAVDAIEHHYEGKSIRLAAHPKGFTDDEISAAVEMMGGTR